MMKKKNNSLWPGKAYMMGFGVAGYKLTNNSLGL